LKDQENKIELVDTFDKIYCRICSKFFSAITHKHLKHHDMTLSEYKALNYPVKSQASHEKASNTHKTLLASLTKEELSKRAYNSGHKFVAKLKRTETMKRLMSDPVKKAKHLAALNSPEAEEKKQAALANKFASMTPEELEEYHRKRGENISKGKTGKKRPDMIGKNNPNFRPGVKEKQQLARIKSANEVKVAKPRKNPYKLGVLNYPEQVVYSILEQAFPGKYQCNTGGQVIRIGRRMPDFINLSDKKIIEHFGRRWHAPEDEPQRITQYTKLGYECLIIWNEELDDILALRNKINSFQTLGPGKLSLHGK
jgi:hypothetical protein